MCITLNSYTGTTCSSIKLLILFLFQAVDCQPVKRMDLLHHDFLNHCFDGEKYVTPMVNCLMAQLTQTGAAGACVVICRNLTQQALDSMSLFTPYRTLWQLDQQTRLRRREWNTFRLLPANDVEQRHVVEPEACVDIANRAVATDTGAWCSADGQPTRVALCGGVNLGKSTSLRFLLNRALKSAANGRTGVALLDMDPGQTECTPAGFLSLSVHHSPLLGPPFTHQLHQDGQPVGQQPQLLKSYVVRMCFLGALSPADDPQHYLSCLQVCHPTDCSLGAVLTAFF